MTQCPKYPYFLYRYAREWWNMYSFSISNIRQFDASFAGEQEPSRAIPPGGNPSKSETEPNE